MPIGNAAQIKRFTTLCGASVPLAVQKRLAELEHDSQSVVQFGVDYAVQECRTLLQGGAPGIHLYTLNQSIQAKPLIAALGLGKTSLP
jgi:methylenetetrahydrofolate reductase (NADPH)